MKALRIHGDNDLRLDDLPEPAIAADEALVAIHAAGICGTDLEIAFGRHRWYQEGVATFPVVPGHEWSGIVKAVGSAVTHLAPGDLVSGETGIGCGTCTLCLTGHHNLCEQVTETGILGRDGAMRELHAQRAAFVHKHRDIDPDAAALTEPATVAVYSCRKAGVTPGDRVAILGAGSIGQLAVQAARAYGAQFVLATSRSEPKLALARRFGADVTVNAATQDLRQVADDVTGGRGFDVVIELSGSMRALVEALDIAALAGRIVLVGTYTTYAESTLMQTISKELTILGVRGSPNVYPETISLMARGLIDPRPVISHRFPLASYSEAFDLAERGGPDVLKVLLMP